MKALIQRVSSAQVTAAEGQHAIKQGFVVLLGVRHGDTSEDASYLARKTVQLRVFEDDAGRMNRSLQETQGELLVVSQFTLYADTRKGNRPSFVRAAVPDVAEPLYESYVAHVRQWLGDKRVKTGWFGADMDLAIHNDGPVTIELCTD
jgi:D-tyrosyl-tRNA(Tyr) deacylase